MVSFVHEGATGHAACSSSRRRSSRRRPAPLPSLPLRTSESRELVTDLLLKRNAYAEATTLKLAEMPVGSLLAYTDGGCDGNGANGVRGASGWGACLTHSVVRKGGSEDPPNRVVDELWGPMDTDPTSEWYMGASEGTTTPASHRRCCA